MAICICTAQAMAWCTSSACVMGAPNRTMIASPMNLSIDPPLP